MGNECQYGVGETNTESYIKRQIDGLTTTTHVRPPERILSGYCLHTCGEVKAKHCLLINHLLSHDNQSDLYPLHS